MSQLLTLQQEFAVCVAKLILWAEQNQIGITFGEAYRTPEQAHLNAQHGTGIVNSLHCQRLAVDLNVIENGKYITDPAPYLKLAAYWKTLHKDAAAGADFHRKDYNHFSLAYGGRE